MSDPDDLCVTEGAEHTVRIGPGEVLRGTVERISAGYLVVRSPTGIVSGLRRDQYGRLCGVHLRAATSR